MLHISGSEGDGAAGAHANVQAVVVTYHPDADFPRRLARVLPQVAATVIVDNGSGEMAQAMLSALSVEPGVELVRNEANLGIAAALNTGVRRALRRESPWALLLDQDTEIDADMVAALLAVARSYPEPDLLAAVASGFRDPSGQAPRAIPLEGGGRNWQEVESAITSGCLLSTRIFAALGGFREEFFIDYVDAEYSLRARRAGNRIVETRAPVMSHSIGSPTAHRWLGKTTWTSNHSADRRYYCARNDTVLLREYGYRGRSGWRLKSLTRCLRTSKRIALHEHGKGAKIRAVWQGWWDAWRGRMGPRLRR